ncbi:MAG: class I SAM-dependent methyltransferase [Planctomycetota bacterium]|jgi:demethylmenaquinone methyltransferase/2-methoxy-6-polyprenyl-1,4-benzoquinol methylase
MVLSNQDIRDAYTRQAHRYDFATGLYRLLGLNAKAYRERAVQRLGLEPGDCVVELGCGTGLSFPLIMERIGPEGRLIGVDLSPGMLEHARQKVGHAGWTNVELVQADMAAYQLPEGVNAVLSVGAFGYVARHDQVIRAAAAALVPGGRIVILDGKQADGVSSWWFKLILWLSRPFGVTLDYGSQRVWESVERHFREPTFEPVYGGMLYISSGTAG